MLGNPVPGHIQSFEEYEAQQWDGVGFIVTSSFAQHIADNRGPGIDIGNGKTGGEVRNMADGVITFAGQKPTAIGMANVVRIWHPGLSSSFGGQRVESGYAHLLAIEVTTIPVAKGQAIGHVGMSGATAPHLHGGVKIGGSATVEGTEIDWFPLLDQNSPERDDMNLKGTPAQPLSDSSKRMETTVTWPAGMGVVADPSTGSPYTLLEAPPGNPIHLAKGKALTIDWQVTGAVWNGSDKWYGLWMWSTPPQFGYVPAAGCGPLVPLVSAGHSDQELEDAEDKGFNEGRQAVIAKTAEVPPR